MKVEIRVVETVSDWFQTVKKTIETDHYDEFKLVANELVWYLEGYVNGVRELYYQVENAVGLVEKLDINHIQGNKYCKIRQLYT